MKSMKVRYVYDPTYVLTDTELYKVFDDKELIFGQEFTPLTDLG